MDHVQNNNLFRENTYEDNIRELAYDKLPSIWDPIAVTDTFRKGAQGLDLRDIAATIDTISSDHLEGRTRSAY